MITTDSLYTEACKHIPGGVNSPVRAFHGVGGDPLFIHAAKGAYVIDSEGKHYIDYVGSWGPMILGHAHPKVIDAVHAAAEYGLSFGAPTEIETAMAQLISQIKPSIEQVRMVNSGTEATMSAIRLARGYTKRNKIVKFAGCYHGHSDGLLVNAGSGALTQGVPSSAGVPESYVQHTLTAEFNNFDEIQHVFERHGKDIAAIIVEPVAGNMSCVLPEPGFLQLLRDLCDKYQSVLIFDEVMTGFRVALGGAQAVYQVTPDLTTLGKVIGGGMPVGAFGGKKEIMQQLSPLGPVYQAGTLSGNPIAMAAGLVTLRELVKQDHHSALAKQTELLCDGLALRAKAHNIDLHINQICGMFGLFFTDQEKITTLDEVKACDVDRFKQFFHGMLANGIYFAPSAFEAGFVSTCHQNEEIELTLQAAEAVFASLR